MEDAAALVAAANALGIALDSRQIARFETYAALLGDWNQRFNLLGPAALAALWSRHLLDALTIVHAVPTAAADRLHVLDVGSGAGLPGIPLAIAFPGWTVTLLEATTKKARFLDLAARELDLSRVSVAHGRAEVLAHDDRYREAFDLCVARAITNAAALVEITVPFVTRGGAVIFYKGLHGLAEELNVAEDARVMLGASAPTVVPVNVAADDARCLVRYDKVSRTPRELPRRAGLPEKQPLTAADRASGGPVKAGLPGRRFARDRARR